VLGHYDRGADPQLGPGLGNGQPRLGRAGDDGDADADRDRPVRTRRAR
jgi:hypothetical protein